MHDAQPSSGSFEPSWATVVDSGVFCIAFFDAPVGVLDQLGGPYADDSYGCHRRGEGFEAISFGQMEREALEPFAQADGPIGFGLQSDDRR